MVIGKQAEPKLSICLLSIPLGEWKGSHTLVLTFLRVLLPSAEKIHLITGNYPEGALPDSRVDLANVRTAPLTRHPQRGFLTRSLMYITAQLKMSLRLFAVASQVDVAILFINGSGMLLPMLTAKLLRKKSVIIAVDAGAEVLRRVYEQSLGGVGGVVAAGIASILQRLNYGLCHVIVVYSPIIVEVFGLERYRDKIRIVHEHFLDFDVFKVQEPLSKRANLIGCVGRLSQEKGILNLLEAIPRVVAAADEAAFLIGGDGQLRSRVQECAGRFGSRVRFVGWIARDELPCCLNELKLLVLPSYTEGLPNIMLEAMACGTPVLATPVGGVPDVITDGATGFIMENNSPECIARNITRALNHPNLERIAHDARALVQREFTFEKAVAGYKNMLYDVLS